MSDNQVGYPLTDLQSRSPGHSPFNVTLFLFGRPERDGGEAGEEWVGCDGREDISLRDCWRSDRPVVL